MRVLYFIQTFRNLPQIERLVRTIKRSSPTAVIVLSHNHQLFMLEPQVFQDLDDVHILNVAGIARSDFSLLQTYLDGLDWARAIGLDFDWAINMTGQCYPTRSLAQFEQMLATTAYDGFMNSYEALVPSAHNPWDRAEALGRYAYQYRWRVTTNELPTSLRKALSVPRRVINAIQPFVHLNTSYGFQIGLQRFPLPFNKHFKLYGGSFFKILSRRALDYLFDMMRQRSDLTEYFRHTIAPEEALPQTFLLNSPELKFSPNYQYYIKWDGSRLGRPHTLMLQDYDAIIANDGFFARKFELAEDSRILDLLDMRIFAGKNPAPVNDLPELVSV
jgi:hypothetical protein